MLAFEPPDWSALLGVPKAVARRRTLGGALACNLSGPRRIKAGAARDHFLGFRGCERPRRGVQVGWEGRQKRYRIRSFQTDGGLLRELAALEEVTVKVLPRPEAVSTVLLYAGDAAAAVVCLNRAFVSPYEVSGGAYLPASAAATITSFFGASGVLALRLEGPAPSVLFRRERLLEEFAADSESAVLDDGDSAAFWQGIGDVLPLMICPIELSGAFRSRQASAPSLARGSRIALIRDGMWTGEAVSSGPRLRAPMTAALQ